MTSKQAAAAQFAVCLMRMTDTAEKLLVTLRGEQTPEAKRDLVRLLRLLQDRVDTAKDLLGDQ